MLQLGAGEPEFKCRHYGTSTLSKESKLMVFLILVGRQSFLSKQNLA
jgi:hypothetical protein